MAKKIIDPQTLDLASYDTIICAFSGGKDSLASFLHLLELGVPKEKIELWHHDIDGHGEQFMDWAITPDYCRKFAKAFGVKIYFSWKEGGFLKEMLRDNCPTASVKFETPETGIQSAGGKSNRVGTRLKFPQMSADLSTRWCSAYLKIDVAAMAIANQKRFDGKKILMVTGERAEESGARAKYPEFEAHKTDCKKRTVHQWRPVHQWLTEDIWNIIRKWKVNPHPCYRLGWGRCSCACCIFGNEHQWASVKAVAPKQFEAVSNYENKFGVTIRRERISINEFAEKGKVYTATNNPELKNLANSTEFTEEIILKEWIEPAGAKSDLTGPC